MVRYVAIDPKDVGELQKALNDAAGKASVLWTTFVIFQLYPAIAFGSVTHRDLHQLDRPTNQRALGNTAIRLNPGDNFLAEGQLLVGWHVPLVC